MLLARSETLPDGVNWSYELKLDGYRAIAILTQRIQPFVQALAKLPEETVIDGEVVAFDESARP